MFLSFIHPSFARLFVKFTEKIKISLKSIFSFFCFTGFFFRTLLWFLIRLRIGSAALFLDNLLLSIRFILDHSFTREKIFRDFFSISSTETLKLFFEHQSVLSNSNTAYASARWSDTKKLLHSSVQLEDKAASFHNVDPLNLRIIGSEIVNSIGHTSFGLALRARMSIMGQNPVQNYWVLGGSCSNNYFLGMWNKYFQSILDVTQSEQLAIERSLWPLVESIQTVRTLDGSLDLVSAHNKYAMAWDEQAYPPLLELSDKDHYRAESFFKEHNWPLSKFVVTLHVREATSSQSQLYGRNASISTYIPAIDEINKRGGLVFRIGNRNMAPLNYPGVVDLTQITDIPDWFPIYVIAISRFMIATTSGPIGVASAFGTPILWTNMPDIGKAVFHSKSLSIPKLVRKPSGKLMSLDEMLGSSFGWSDSFIHEIKDKSDCKGYMWVDNTYSDIKNGALEMMNDWSNSETEFQSQWSKSLRDFGSSGFTRVSDQFLSRYADTLKL